ncbi:hypothetical protein [Pengzhenrongella sicca]|uniref:DUF4232 domain-containing protein n=1 Tax=Pengzhenrongella sicca TaxID=2819238 RepID=A0A8A4ZF55_9MICO|nr:hypothetical protein [Pengzhenrongella sicca]QTE29176.1 hypothetical protein J4E96_18105 [Pengzhenrongella sicca]
MSTVLHPVGPNPPRVYWVRRLVVVIAAALVVAALGIGVWALALRDGGDDASSPDAAADAAASAAADEDPAGGAPVDCAPANLQLTVVPNAVQYAADAAPTLTVTVTNVGAEPCTVDAGDASREVIISSGTDRIWSSKDCASAETASRQLLLAAGASDPVDIAWTRSRSAEGCPADLPAPRAGTYQVAATLLGASAAPAVFALE